MLVFKEGTLISGLHHTICPFIYRPTYISATNDNSFEQLRLFNSGAPEAPVQGVRMHPHFSGGKKKKSAVVDHDTDTASH